MIVKHRVSTGDVNMVRLRVACLGTFGSTTDSPASIRASQRDLPYFCVTGNSHVLLMDAMASFSAWISICLKVSGDEIRWPNA